MKDFVRSGRLELVEWARLVAGCALSSRLLKIAAKQKDLAMVKCLHNLNLSLDSKALKAAALSGDLELVRYFVDQGAPRPKKFLSNAIISNNLSLVKFLVEDLRIKKVKLKTDMKYAFATGNEELIEYLRLTDPERFRLEKFVGKGRTLEIIAKSGNLPLMIKFSRISGYLLVPFDVIREAVRFGHMHILDWDEERTILLQSGDTADWVRILAHVAIKHAQMSFFEWLEARKIVIPSLALIDSSDALSINPAVYEFLAARTTTPWMHVRAIRDGKLELAEKWESQLSRIEPMAMTEAVRIGNMDLILRLRDKGIPISPGAMASAIFNGNFEVTKQLYDLGVPLPPLSFRFSLNSWKDIKLLKFLCEKHGLDGVESSSRRMVLEAIEMKNLPALRYFRSINLKFLDWKAVWRQFLRTSLVHVPIMRFLLEEAEWRSYLAKAERVKEALNRYREDLLPWIERAGLSLSEIETAKMEFGPDPISSESDSDLDTPSEPF